MESNVKSGFYSLIQKPNAKSTIWTLFDLIVKDDGSIAEGYVNCRVCKKFLKYNGKSTSNLNRHKCYMLAVIAADQKKVNEEHRNEAIDACTLWLLQDCLPCNIIQEKGFRKMLQFFIKLGSVYGENVDIDDLLPDSTTVAESIRTMADGKKSKIIPQIEKIGKDVSVAVDIWPDYYLKRQFLSATLHFQKNLELNTIQLGIKSTDIKSNAREVHDILERLLNEYGVKNMETIVFISDNQSIIKEALLNRSTLICSNYLFSQVVDTAIEQTAELNEVIADCKIIVQNCKNSCIQMSKRSASKIKCGSNFGLIKSITHNWQQVQEHLQNSSPKLLTNKKSDTLCVIVQLFHKFEVIFKRLQTSRSPSLCFVIPSINCIKAFCKPKETDEPAISAFKSNILQCLEKTWLPNITLWHKVAFFLYPPANKEQTDDLDEIKDFCIQQIMDMEQNVSTLEKATNLQSDSSTLETSSKPLESVNSEINEDISFFFPTLVRKSLQAISKSPEDEVNRYVIEYAMIDESFNAIQWWHENSAAYPRLSKLALRILSIPASNAFSQRAYALAGNIVSEELNKCSPNTVDNILFLNSMYEKNV